MILGSVEIEFGLVNSTFSSLLMEVWSGHSFIQPKSSMPCLARFLLALKFLQSFFSLSYKFTHVYLYLYLRLCSCFYLFFIIIVLIIYVAFFLSCNFLSLLLLQPLQRWRELFVKLLPIFPYFHFFTLFFVFIIPCCESKVIPTLL